MISNSRISLWPYDTAVLANVLPFCSAVLMVWMCLLQASSLRSGAHCLPCDTGQHFLRIKVELKLLGRAQFSRFRSWNLQTQISTWNSLNWLSSSPGELVFEMRFFWHLCCRVTRTPRASGAWYADVQLKTYIRTGQDKHLLKNSDIPFNVLTYNFLLFQFPKAWSIIGQ